MGFPIYQATSVQALHSLSQSFDSNAEIGVLNLQFIKELWYTIAKENYPTVL